MQTANFKIQNKNRKHLNFTVYSLQFAVCLAIIFSFLLPATSFSKSPSYKKVYKKWTRSDSVYGLSDFHASILWSATPLNDQVIEAQAKKFAKAYEVPLKEEEEELERLKEKRGDKVLFFVSFYSYDRHFDDLENPGSKWDLRLEAGEMTYRPVRFEKFNRPNPLDKLYYPGLGPWSSGYYVWFPAEAGMRPYPWILSVHGPKAHSKLKWK